MREKFRDSDVELRNSASAKEGENNESSKQLIGSSSKKLKGLLIGGIVFSTAILIAIIITYFAVYKNVDDQVNSISETCTDSDPAVSLLKDPPKTIVRIYPFNITNPYDYVRGSTPNVDELGVYAINLQQQRKNVDVSKSKKTISFNLWNEVSFNPSKSCSNCNADDIINVPNIAFLTLLSQVQNEAALLLQATCTPFQISLITNPGTYPYCAPTDMGKNVNCVCCARTATPNATTCSALTGQTTKPGGLLSYLAKYDDGLQLNSVPSSFALSTGAYTPLVRKMSVSQVAFGSVSAYAGMFKTASAYRNGDWKTVWENGNTTIDLRDACVLACPSVNSVVQKFSTQLIAAFQNVECNGTVPSADILVSQGGLSQERADQLRYLEGVTCRPFSINVAVAAILTVLPATNVCSDGSSTLPCCLLSSTSTLVTANGIGCHQWVNGLVQSRRVYSVEDALAHIKPSPYTEFYSGCASGRNKFQQIYWKGESYYDEWFTPASYVYPKMPWADPVIMRKGKSRSIPGSMTLFNISGFQVAVREGRGITSKFLDYDFTDGDPKYTEEEIWSSFKLRTLNITYQKRSEVQGIETNHFLVTIPNLTTSAEIEVAQKTGQMPYQNLENLVYALDGAPIIMSLPNWYGSNPNILSQTSNTDRGSPSKTGVNVYRTRTSYSKDSQPLSEPELITEATWETYGNQVYRGKVDIEPGTGLTLTGQIANQLSVFTWNCNPTIDSTCALQAAAQSATDPLCYLNGVTQYPCSAANVFTPKVMGGKVIPVYFLTTDPDAPDKVIKQLQFGLSIRYALSILVIIIPFLAAGVAAFLGYRLYHVIKDENESKFNSDNNNNAVLQTTFTSDAMPK